MKVKLSLKWRVRYKLWNWCSKLGNYCNNNPGNKYAYAFYRFMAAIVY